MKKQMKLIKAKRQKNKSKNTKKRKKLSYIILALSTFGIWLFLLVIKLVNDVQNGSHVEDSLWMIVNGIFDNLLGVLPPILIFDLFLKYLQNEDMLEDVSKQITGAIMTKPEVIQEFDDDAKKRFLSTTVDALVEHHYERHNMAMGAIAPYIDRKFDIRTRFQYFIDIGKCDDSSGFKSDEYMLVRENLLYEIIYIASEPLGNSAHLAFFIDNRELDEFLREESQTAKNRKYIMRESLDIAEKEFDYIKSIAAKGDIEIKEYITKIFQPQLQDDNGSWQVGKIEVNNCGIDIEFISPKGDKATSDISTRSIAISFNMPHLKRNASLFVSISQPTFSPQIRLSYDPKDYTAKMVPFFNKEVDMTVGKSEQGIGQSFINIKDKWVHPMSGAIFFIEGKGI